MQTVSQNRLGRVPTSFLFWGHMYLSRQEEHQELRIECPTVTQKSLLTWEHCAACWPLPHSCQQRNTYTHTHHDLRPTSASYHQWEGKWITSLLLGQSQLFKTCKCVSNAEQINRFYGRTHTHMHTHLFNVPPMCTPIRCSDTWLIRLPTETAHIGSAVFVWLVVVTWVAS